MLKRLAQDQAPSILFVGLDIDNFSKEIIDNLGERALFCQLMPFLTF